MYILRRVQITKIYLFSLATELHPQTLGTVSDSWDNI